MSDNFRYLKNNSSNLLATQSNFTDNLLNNDIIYIEPGFEFFEVQTNIGNKMHSKIQQHNPNDWTEITNQEFINLITKRKMEMFYQCSKCGAITKESNKNDLCPQQIDLLSDTLCGGTFNIELTKEEVIQELKRDNYSEESIIEFFNEE
jgi:hypothetical protein